MNRRNFLKALLATTTMTAFPLASLYADMKVVDASWAAGTQHDLLSNTWYHVFIIRNTDEPIEDLPYLSMGNVFNFAFSADPDGHDLMKHGKVRRLGSVLTDKTANIVPFTQVGGTHYWV